MRHGIVNRDFKEGKKTGNSGLPVGVFCMKGPLSAIATLSSPVQKPKQPIILYSGDKFQIEQLSYCKK